MSFPNESGEHLSPAEHDLDSPPLAPVQSPFPENIPEQTGVSSNDRPKKSSPLSALQIIHLVIVGSLILFELFIFFFFKGMPMPSVNIQATQRASMAQQTSTVRAGNATTIALETTVPHMSPQAIYQAFTQGKALFRDPLTDGNNTYFYNPDTLQPDPGCVFQKDGLHITSSDVGTWVPCNNSAFPDLMSFSFQYDFVLLKGDDAGLRFRATGTTCYYFSLNISGRYKLIYYPDVTDGATAQTIRSGATKLMHKGYGVKNQVTLIAIGNFFYVYLNQQFFLKATNQALRMGGISLLVESEKAPTEAVFSQAVAWNIAGMAP